MTSTLHALQRLWAERSNKLWVQPAIHSVLAVLLALGAAWIPPLLPGMDLPRIEAKTLDSLLTVIASSMLAVTTFSLSIMVSAFASASNGVTPRATELVMGDEGTRSAIANFLSAFMFSIVAQVALGLRYYGDNGRFILFVATCGVLAWLMLTLLRWVRTLSSLGRLANTLERVEKQALQTLTAYWQQPCLGAQPSPALEAPGRNDPTAHGSWVRAHALLQVRRLDLPRLQALAEAHDCRLHLRVRPGDRVCPGEPLCWVEPLPSSGSGSGSEAAPPADASTLHAAIAQAVVLDTSRTFDQDPRFGLIVLCEAGQRALSAAINDPGTAIACLDALARVLVMSQREAAAAAQGPRAPRYDRLTLVPLELRDFVEDAFGPLMRDGAGSYEMGVRLQKLLATVATHSLHAPIAEAARAHAHQALEFAQEQLPHASDRQALRRLHQQLWQQQRDAAPAYAQGPAEGMPPSRK